MKKLLASLVLISFAVAAQAGDNKATCSDKEKSACCTMKTSNTATCSMAKGTTCHGMPTRHVVMSPKGAEQAPKMLLASK